MTGPAAIDLQDVFCLYRTPEGDAAALQGLTLRVEQGEVLVLLGPSGSGKSTLLRLLAALEAPSAGIARVFGADVGKLSPRAAAAFRARSLGLIDQHYDRALPPDLTCRAIVGLQLALRGARRAERDLRATALLERVGLQGFEEARPAELSGGEQQRVSVCAALAHRPALLLADEPAGELDETSVGSVYGLIGDLAREEGATVVLVSHDPASATIADRALRLRDGRVSDELAGGGEEVAVVGRGGWLHVPVELLRRAGIDSHARLEPGPDGIRLGAIGEPVTEPVDELAELSPRPAREGLVAELRAVEKTYGSGRRRRAVLDGFDAVFQAGCLTAVTGRSGSGKTTILRLLAGLELPDAGEVHVHGERVDRLDRAARARFRRRDVALVGQDPGLVAFLSATENVTLALTLRGLDRAEAEQRARTWLDRLGLERRRDQHASRLSAGERQRVAIARALAADPALLVVDEPTSRLDQVNAEQVSELLARAARVHGATIVCATHEPMLVRRADREIALGAAVGAG